MCRTGCCGVLLASPFCWYCRWLAYAAERSARGHVRVRWMTAEAIEYWRVQNGGMKTPVFLPDESVAPILGFGPVTRRVLREIMRRCSCGSSVASSTLATVE